MKLQFNCYWTQWLIGFDYHGMKFFDNPRVTLRFGPLVVTVIRVLNKEMQW